MRTNLACATALIALALPFAAPTAALAQSETASAPQATSAPMTAHDLATLVRVAAPAVSPDGSQVAWQETHTDPATYLRKTRLRLAALDAADAAPTAIAPGASGSDSAPAFGPDGAIYFLSTRSGTNQLWMQPRGDGAPVQLTSVQSDIAGFKVSPDGRRVLIWGDMGARCPEFGCAEERTTDGSGRHYGDGAGFIRHWDSWKVPGQLSRPFVFDLMDGKAVNGRAIDPNAMGNSPAKPFGGGEELAWNADSKSVFFTVRRADRDEPRSTNIDIWQAPADGSSAPVNLTADNPATDTLPTPSPDGKYLAYAAMARPGYESDRQVLMLRDLRTGRTRAVTQDWDRSVGSIAWTPDSKAVIVTALDTLEHPAFRVDIANGKVTRLTTRGNIFDVIPLKDGGMVYALNSIAAPTDIIHRPASGMGRNISNANAARLAGMDAVQYEQFSFAGANGETVHGQILYPMMAKGPLPTLFLVHGGPQGSFFNSWSTRWNPKLFASAGYAVVSVDFHGSTGYGQAFTDSINRDWGGKPLVDLKLGLAAAARTSPMVRADKACALGGSYGGYMMNWIAGNWPDGFKCLVNHAGIFDLRMMAYTTEELWFDEYDHGGPWWQRVDAEKWNPVNHVTKWQTPTLFIHGEKDFRIPYTHSIAGYTAAQRRGVPAELLIYPDENHWILKGRNSVQWYRTVFDFVGRHLQD